MAAAGAMLVTLGAFTDDDVKVNWAAGETPAAVVTVTLTGPTVPEGATAVIDVSELTMKLVAVARSNPKLRDAINRVLGDMRRDGTYALLFQKWFQVKPPSGEEKNAG